MLGVKGFLWFAFVASFGFVASVSILFRTQLACALRSSRPAKIRGFGYKLRIVLRNVIQGRFSRQSLRQVRPASRARPVNSASVTGAAWRSSRFEASSSPAPVRLQLRRSALGRSPNYSIQRTFFRSRVCCYVSLCNKPLLLQNAANFGC